VSSGKRNIPLCPQKTCRPLIIYALNALAQQRRTVTRCFPTDTSRYGTEVGALRWEQAAPGADPVPDKEINPRDGDIIIFRRRGALVEGAVVKRNGLKVRVKVWQGGLAGRMKAKVSKKVSKEGHRLHISDTTCAPNKTV